MTDTFLDDLDKVLAAAKSAACSLCRIVDKLIHMQGLRHCKPVKNVGMYLSRTLSSLFAEKDILTDTRQGIDNLGFRR